MAQNLNKGNLNYVYGNTVPSYVPEPQGDDLYTRKLKEREERFEKERILREQRKNRKLLEREKKASKFNMVVCLSATVMIMVCCALYIHLQSELNSRMNKVAALETEVLNLTTENDATEKRIETSVDLLKIRDKAMKELGMVYPKEDQIVYISVKSNDYMEQYKDIPSK